MLSVIRTYTRVGTLNREPFGLVFGEEFCQKFAPVPMFCIIVPFNPRPINLGRCSLR